MSDDPALVAAFDRAVVPAAAALAVDLASSPPVLTAVAAQRHGQAALIHALSRPQRSTGPISAF